MCKQIFSVEENNELMAALSQRSVAQLIRTFEKLGCYEDTSYTGIHTPPVSAKDLKRELFARNFDRPFLERCAPQNIWNFDRIFTALYDGSFFDSPPRGRSWPAVRDRLEYLSDPIRQKEQTENGHKLLLEFAEYIFHKKQTLADHEGWYADANELLKSLELDGFRLYQGHITATTAASPQKEVQSVDQGSVTPTTILKLIRDRSGLDHQAIDTALAACEGDRYLIRKTIGELQQAGLIVFENGRYAITDHWMQIQGLLGISLTTLTNIERVGSGISIHPMFGKPRAVSAPDIFVLMPFDTTLRPIYDDHIRAVASQLTMSVGRADDFFTTHAVMDDIWAAVYGAKIVIGDCTGRNPNVFYEIGMAHTIGKPVILITQNEADVPFDLQSLRYIHYSYTPPGMRLFEERLLKTIRGLAISVSV